MPEHLAQKLIGPRGIPTPQPLDPDHPFEECGGCETHTDDWWAYLEGQPGWVDERRERSAWEEENGRPYPIPSAVSVGLCPLICPDHGRHCTQEWERDHRHACVFCEESNA